MYCVIRETEHTRTYTNLNTLSIQDAIPIWYFRNALVRANYNDYSKGIFATSEYLMYFFENLLLGENHQLSNRNIHLNVGEMSEKNVGEREHAILKIMSEQNTVSAKELAQLLSITDRTIERDIKHLKELGLVERIGGGRGGYWKVKE